MGLVWGFRVVGFFGGEEGGSGLGILGIGADVVLCCTNMHVCA